MVNNSKKTSFEAFLKHSKRVTKDVLYNIIRTESSYRHLKHTKNVFSTFIRYKERFTDIQNAQGRLADIHER